MLHENLLDWSWGLKQIKFTISEIQSTKNQNLRLKVKIILSPSRPSEISSFSTVHFLETLLDWRKSLENNGLSLNKKYFILRVPSDQ